jgi:hypothetical protein
MCKARSGGSQSASCAPAAALSLSYTSASRPIVSLDDLSSLECALIGATATTEAIIASKGNNLRALPDDDLAAAVETIRAFADADDDRQA